MNIISFRECEYSAFISYSHDDDRAWNKWVTSFGKELQLTLPSRLRKTSMPVKVHLSGINGPASGELSAELRQRISRSFAMILVVHESYVESGWCQQELEFFRSQFGEIGLRERLYILALSKTAIEALVAQPAWKHLVPGGELVWLPFYRELQPDMPISIYSDAQPDLVTNTFWEPFVRFREDLVGKIKSNVAPVPRSNATPTDDIVRIYIESNQNEVDHWEAIGKAVVKCWERITQQMTIAPPLYLRPTGLQIEKIDQGALLEDADGVILLWGAKTPDSLDAQMGKVEGKLAGPHLTPRIVAYLTPPQAAAEQPIPAWRWPIFRFDTRAGTADGFQVAPADAAGLDGFLRSALARKRARGNEGGVTAANR